MQNAELLLRSPVIEVSDKIIRRLPDFKSALKMCVELSGLTQPQVCQELGIDNAQWSRIWSGTAHFPPEKIVPLMDLCGNEIPLVWLATVRGYELKPTQTAVEKENAALREELEQNRAEMDAIKKFMKDIKAV